MSDTELLPATTTTPTPTEVPTPTNGDEPEVAHIGRRDEITRAYVTGEAITALCGTKFVPTRDPSRYPVCQVCQEVMAGIRAGRGGTN